MDTQKILIIEDDYAIAELLQYGMEEAGFIVQTASSGIDGLMLLPLFKPDLLLLDWMLPDMSGLDICKKVTAAYAIPIVMLTAKSDVVDKVIGLEHGADDYITKPFDLREVGARIRTVLRRMEQANQNTNTSVKKRLQFKDIEIVLSEHLVLKAGQAIDLTPKEYELLLKIATSPGQVFSRTELLNGVWGYDFVGDTRTVDTHIQRLRKKLDIGDRIVTVFGIGYKFTLQVEG